LACRRLPRSKRSSMSARPRRSGALTIVATFLKLLPPLELRSTNTLFFPSTLEASTILLLAGETVIAYQNFVGITPVDFVQVLPPSVVTESDDWPWLRSQT